MNKLKKVDGRILLLNLWETRKDGKHEKTWSAHLLATINTFQDSVSIILIKDRVVFAPGFRFSFSMRHSHGLRLLQNGTLAPRFRCSFRLQIKIVLDKENVLLIVLSQDKGKLKRLPRRKMVFGSE